MGENLMYRHLCEMGYVLRSNTALNFIRRKNGDAEQNCYILAAEMSERVWATAVWNYQVLPSGSKQ